MHKGLKALTLGVGDSTRGLRKRESSTVAHTDNQEQVLKANLN